jgi:hypothetical protein
MEDRMWDIGFDLGTVTGVADGFQGNRPRIWTWDLQDAGHGRPAKLALFQKWLESYLRTTVSLRPVKEIRIFYEAPLSVWALLKMGKQAVRFFNDDSDLLLKAMVGILEASAFNVGIRHIEPVNARSARAKFRKGATTKEHVAARCKTLGWETANLNESDAVAIWAYGAVFKRALAT